MASTPDQGVQTYPNILPEERESEQMNIRRRAREPSVYGECCGVCQFEGRHCGSSAEPGAVHGMLAAYRTQSNLTFDDFDPETLLQHFKGHTLWFIGDSQVWHFYYAAECALRGYATSWVRRNVTEDAALVERLRTEAWPRRRPLCLHLAHASRVCAVRANTGLELLNALQVMSEMGELHSFDKDTVVMNVGLHYAAQEFDSYHQHLQAAVDFIESHQKELPHLIWMDTPVKHRAVAAVTASTPLGSHCKPLTDRLAMEGGSHNVAVADLVARMQYLGVSTLWTWNLTVPLWNLHRTGECTHYCSPSAYHVWLYMLDRLMAEPGF